MNNKYKKYIDYIAKDIEVPYFKNMRDYYGLRPNEYEMVLSKIYNQPVIIKGRFVYNNQGNIIYLENSDGYWYKQEYDEQGNITYYENSIGNWVKYEYDDQGNEIYYEDSYGYWEKRECDEHGNITYLEDSYGYIEDNR